MQLDPPLPAPPQLSNGGLPPSMFDVHRLSAVPLLLFGPTFPEHIRVVMVADRPSTSSGPSERPPPPAPMTAKEMTNDHYYGKKVTFKHGVHHWGGGRGHCRPLHH